MVGARCRLITCFFCLVCLLHKNKLCTKLPRKNVKPENPPTYKRRNDVLRGSLGMGGAPKRLKQKKPVLSDKCIQSSAITLINNENVISDDFNPFAPCDPT